MGKLYLVHILLAACLAQPCSVSAQAAKPVADSEVPSGLGGTSNVLDKCVMIAGAEFYVAIDNKGNWPNLVALPGGEIGAFIYNHPSHGFGCGDIELWMSADGGRLWTFRSQVSDHSDAPAKVRMNHAVGFNAKGELVVAVSGWSEGRKMPILPVQVCISGDGGRQWQRHELPVNDVPFGKIICSPDGTLTSVWYNKSRANLYASRDGGRTWQLSGALAENGGGETALLRCRSGKWLAMMRNSAGPMTLFASSDEGRTWSSPRPAPVRGYPGDLLQLADGKILLTCGRGPGVVAAVSDDEGATWSPAMTFLSVPWKETDHGYPSSAQLDDGTIVTAYYFGGRKGEEQYGGRADLPNSHGLPWHRRYHMGVMRYRLEDLGKADKGW